MDDEPRGPRAKIIPLRRRRTQLARSRGSRAPQPMNRALEKLAYYGLEAVGTLQGRAARSRVQVHRNIPYLGSGRHSHVLDVYVPEGRKGPLPVVLYVHGGAFMWCSKETHFIFAHAYAQQGFIVFNINYRLAPRHMYPAAIEDVCEAARYVQDNATRFGGDPKRLVFAGESAGANLVSSLALTCCMRRPEPWARAVFDAGIMPKAVVAACGILQVTDAQRFSARRKLPRVVRRILHLLPDAYVDLEKGREAQDLADPLLVVESGVHFERPLPPFFLPVGTADPLLDDSRRMARALHERRAEVEARYYPGEIHAFHTMFWREQAQQCWHDTFRFIDARLRGPRLVRIAG